MSGPTASRWSVRRLFTGTRINRVLLAVAVAVAVTAVGFGTGYRGSRAAFSDGGAYLQKGDRIVHVNANGGDADAQTAKNLATGEQTLEVVQVSPGVVYVVNNDTGAVTRLPTDTLIPQPVEQRPQSKKKLTVVAGGGRSYLVDAERGTLSRLEGGNGPSGSQVSTPVKVQQAVVDSKGVVWAYAPEGGELLQIVDGVVKARPRVTGSGEPATLTLVADAPVLYRPDSGQAALYGPDGLRRVVDLGAPYGVAAAPGAAEPVLAVVLPRTGELVVADFDARDPRRIELPDRHGHQFGAPVVHNGRAYVPDYRLRHVLVVDLAAQRIVSTVQVPGTSPTFQVTVRDNRVWVSDPRDRGVITFDGDGRPTDIDVGEGSGVRDKPLDRPTPSANPSTGPRQPADPGPVRPPRPPRVPAPQLVTVPDVVGKNRDEACEQLKPDLRCVQVARPDGDGETDQVLSTDPPSGSRIEKGRPVTVVYRGPATVPDVVGLPADQACRALVDARLTCQEQVGGLAADATGIRVVTAQDQPAGGPADTGSPVTVTYPAQIAVGSFANQSVTTACAAIAQVGLACQPNPTGPGAPANAVLAQAPAPGAGLDPGGAVVLDYFTNATVPPLVGLDPGSACAQLQAVRLVCNPNDNAQDPRPNLVLAQDIAPGTEVGVGTPVTYTYESTGPGPLYRYKANGLDARLLSLSGDIPSGFSAQGEIGKAYPPAGGAPGLVAVHQFRCSNNCGGTTRDISYYYSQSPDPPTGRYVREGVAFSCFGAPVASGGGNTRPLQAMYSDARGAWAFAPIPSAEHDIHAGDGYTDRFTICHIW